MASQGVIVSCVFGWVAERLLGQNMLNLDLPNLISNVALAVRTSRILKIKKQFLEGNRIQSSRRLERECLRNVELMWLTGRLAPDFKTIADFRHDNGAGIRPQSDWCRGP